MSEQKYCKHCGQLIDADCVICPKCGKQVEELKYSRPDNIIINNNNSASSAVSSGTKRMKFPWYLKISWILILGFFTGGIYWLIGAIWRTSWKNKYC